MKPYYEEPGITIYHGDCRDILPNLDTVDLVLTDPPYLIGAKGCGLAGDREYLHTITETGIDSGFDSSILSRFENWFCFCGKQQIYEILTLANTGNWKIGRA